LDFKNAEVLLNCSLLFGEPSIMIIGKNGIGKTKMIEAVYNNFRKTSDFYGTDMDFGGLRQNVIRMIGEKKKNFVLGDMQTILTRKMGVKTAALGLMAGLITEGYQLSGSFTKDQPIPTGIKKGYKINFVTSGTPSHFIYMVNLSQYDFLNRFLIIPVDRDDTDFNPDCYKLHNEILKTVDIDDRKWIKSYKNKNFKNMSMRHKEFCNVLIKNLHAFGIDGKDFIEKNDINIFEPPNFEGKIENMNKLVTKLKVIE
jgi:hypothetical protein